MNFNTTVPSRQLTIVVHSEPKCAETLVKGAHESNARDYIHNLLLEDSSI